MAFPIILMFLLLTPTLIFSSPVQDPESVVQEVQKYVIFHISFTPQLDPVLFYEKSCVGKQEVPLSFLLFLFSYQLVYTILLVENSDIIMVFTDNICCIKHGIFSKSSYAYALLNLIVHKPTWGPKKQGF